MIKVSLLLLAGGLGKRLRSAERLPKPLVDVNGFPLIARVANQLFATNIIEKTYILCSDVNISSHIDQLQNSFVQSFAIVSESQKSGRYGAVQNFVLDNPHEHTFLVANADTLFSGIDPQTFMSINLVDKNPIVFLGYPDDHRNDFAQVNPNLSGFSSMLQNSGLVILTREWVLENIQMLPCDLDQLILNHNSRYINLKVKIYDGGTPNRLQQIRHLFK